MAHTFFKVKANIIVKTVPKIKPPCIYLVFITLLQLRVAHISKDELNLPSEDTMRRMYEAAQGGQGGGGGDAQDGGKKKWRRGEVEFEALMRHLDNCVCIISL